MNPIDFDSAAFAKAAELLRSARLAIALTGAGFSTPSGIPDFRSKGTGLWEHDDPMEVASLTTFQNHPERFYGWVHSLSAAVWKAKPNPAHIALAELENAGVIKAVITQNIDGLHQAAGSVNVFELHGTLRSLTCIRCHATVDAEMVIPDFIKAGTLPLCPGCQGLLKPDIILFEEMLPEEAWGKAEQYCSGCDVILVVGSSLEVIPASRLPLRALEKGAHLIINNRTPTYLDSYADAILREDLGMIIPALTRRVLK
ncbi:MAG: NAD-dependent deacylase [Anaerolineaceae bacterium]|nr:NAD-dependent deacylase [Anaerolineaceae bacterium]